MRARGGLPVRTCIAVYLPAPGSRFQPEAFIANLRANPPASPVIFFSDHDWPEVLDMGTLYKVRSPELVIKNTPQRKFNVSNLLFLTGLKLLSVNLKDQGFTHFIFLEADVRLGCPKWDEFIIEEFKESRTHPVPIHDDVWGDQHEYHEVPDNPGPIVGGTVCLYSGFTGPAQERAEKLVAKNTKKNFPVAQYRGTSAFGPCVFAMGAGAIYSIAGVKSLFTDEELSNHAKLAGSMQAFDLAIGQRVWSKYGADSFDRIVHLDTLWSGYGNGSCTEAERLQMLKDGSRVLCHQFKSGGKI